MVQLSDELLRVLDAAARRRGVSRSSLIREAVEAFLREDVDAEIGRQIADGYRRIPQDTPDGWADMGRGADRAHQDLAKALDAEERAAGLDPW